MKKKSFLTLGLIAAIVCTTLSSCFVRVHDRDYYRERHHHHYDHGYYGRY